MDGPEIVERETEIVTRLLMPSPGQSWVPRLQEKL